MTLTDSRQMDKGEMMKTMTFDVISDSRFVYDVISDNKRKVDGISAALNGLSGVYFNHDDPRVLHFGDPEPCVSVRTKFYIQNERSVKREIIRSTINEIYAPYYRTI